MSILNAMKNREKILLEISPFLASLYLSPRLNVLLTDGQQADAVAHLVHLHHKVTYIDNNAKQEIPITTPDAEVNSNSLTPGDALETLLKAAEQMKQTGASKENFGIQSLLKAFP